MIAFDSRDFQSPSFAERAISMQPYGSLFRPYFICRLTAFVRDRFTEIDQAFLVWSALVLLIFSLGQFSAMDWADQAVLDALLTGVGVMTTSGLTWAIASSAGLRWVIFLWMGLMTIGTVVTVYGVFCGSAMVLSNLCLLWLGLCAVGYGAMAVGMRSRCFTTVFWVHLGAIGLLHCTPSWQFFNSGLVMASTLFFFSFVPWDMRSSEEIPISSFIRGFCVEI